MSCMDPNPYQPPRTVSEAYNNLVGPISADKESQVMREIGRRRSRGFSLAMAISWPIILALLMFGVGLGLVLGGIASAALAAGFAKLLVKIRKQAIIRAVLREHGVPVGALDPAKYIMD